MTRRSNEYPSSYQYLQQIAAEELREKIPEIDVDELPHVQLWRDLLQLSENLTVQYRTIQNDRKGKPFTDYHIAGVSGCEHSWTLKERLLAIFEIGFDTVLLKLFAMDFQAQRTILESLKNGLATLLGAIGNGVHTWKEDKPGAVEEFRYPRFTRLSYRGDNDLRLAFDHKARDFMDFRLQFYAEEWVDGIHIINRKMEYAINNLSLVAVYATKAVYDVANILNNTFVLELAEGASQGKVIGTRTISGIQHLLVSNPLVTGNSGGPVLNREGKVIGVVVTGADSLRSAPTTEKHGLVPINVLEWLLAQDML